MTEATSKPFFLKAGFLIPIGLLVVALITLVSLYNYYATLQQEAVSQETALNAQYLSNQNYLSSYVSGFYEQLGVANTKSDKLNSILLDAVKGRYESSGGFAPNGAFFSAIQESYPDLTANMNIYDKIVDYIQAKREGYRGMQDKLLDMLAVYDRWRQSGPIQSFLIRAFIGAPTEALKARIGEKVKTGKDALEQMYLIVNTKSVQEAYETGTMEPLAVPTATPKATPQTSMAPAANSNTAPPVPPKKKK